MTESSCPTATVTQCPECKRHEPEHKEGCSRGEPANGKPKNQENPLVYSWRRAIEDALGVENDRKNHDPTWAFKIVRDIRETGNRPAGAGVHAVARVEAAEKAAEISHAAGVEAQRKVEELTADKAELIKTRNELSLEITKTSNIAEKRRQWAKQLECELARLNHQRENLDAAIAEERECCAVAAEAAIAPRIAYYEERGDQASENLVRSVEYTATLAIRARKDGRK